jgi:hypothetical protein
MVQRNVFAGTVDLCPVAGGQEGGFGLACNGLPYLGRVRDIVVAERIAGR